MLSHGWRWAPVFGSSLSPQLELLLGEEILGGAGRGRGSEMREGTQPRPATTATDQSPILFRKSEASVEHAFRVIPPEGPGSWVFTHPLLPLALWPAAQATKGLQVKRKSSGRETRCWYLELSALSGKEKGVGRSQLASAENLNSAPLGKCRHIIYI